MAFAAYPALMKEGSEMHYTLENQTKKLIIGIEIRTTNQESSSAIPALWGKFYKDNVLAKIPNKVNDNVFALYTDYEGDHTKPYFCVIGCEVSSLDVLPHGLVGKTIPESKYAVFTTQGPFPQGLRASWQAIWDSKLQRSYTCDFERYPSDFNPQENPEVTIYIAVDNDPTIKSHPFSVFLKTLIPLIESKSKQLNQAVWLLETTGSSDAAELKAALDAELKMLFHDPETYRQLLEWDNDPALQDPILKRELNVLIRAFKSNQISKELIEEIAQKEAALTQTYANFRPQLDGKSLTENDIRDILKNENDPAVREKAWLASKQIGEVLAPQILDLVELRNRAARSLNYSNFFEMQLDLQEVDDQWLSQTLESLSKQSDQAYSKMLSKVDFSLQKRFSRKTIGPWAWSEPFCQEDPLDARELDQIVDGVDITSACRGFYQKMGFDVQPILDKSDMLERSGKNQHAFCINIDRKGDIRTLNNVKSSIKWLETVLHELGHAIYEQGFDQKLPWLLREPPHMIPTEAMALLAGRQAYRSDSLSQLVGSKKPDLMQKADESLLRRQLIFSRWVLVMTAFERELYRQPSQDLNRLWWNLVEKYQKISVPKGREGKADWAAKVHIGMAPVYYFSYLLGELFASAIQESLVRECGQKSFHTPETGRFIRERLFAQGNRWSWMELIRNVTGETLSPDAWIREFCSNKILTGGTKDSRP
jgi:peptidyl-dipeptidase A